MVKNKDKPPVKNDEATDLDYRLEDLIIDSFLMQRRVTRQGKKCYINSELKSTVKNSNGHVGQSSRIELTSVAI